MSRRPHQRSTRGEEIAVRRRIKWELAQKHWSYHDLARALTDAGHPTHPSAISKLLNGSPPRRITLNEFAALAEVFGRRPEELLAAKEAFLSERANELLTSMEEAQASVLEGAIPSPQAIQRRRQRREGRGHRPVVGGGAGPPGRSRQGNRKPR